MRRRYNPSAQTWIPGEISDFVVIFFRSDRISASSANFAAHRAEIDGVPFQSERAGVGTGEQQQVLPAKAL
jgi:hypothetical protein